MGNEENSDQNSEKNYVLTGSLIGAGIGFLSSSQASKSLLKKVAQSEAAKTLAAEARNTVQDIVMEQVTSNFKNSISSYFDPNANSGSLPEKLMEAGKNSLMKGIGGDSSEEGSSNESSKDKEELEKMKKENEELNDRLDRMEEMLSKFVDSQNK